MWKKIRKKLKSDLGYIKQGPAYYESSEQLNTIENIKSLYESREKVVQLFNNYARNMSKIFTSENKEQDLKY